MRKIFVLDTNILIHNPEAIFSFEEHRVIIPIQVIEELDDNKKGNSEIAFSARKALRLVNKCRKKGEISKGVPLSNGGVLQICFFNENYLYEEKTDNKIISAAIHVKKNNKEAEVIFVSKDTAASIKADYFDISVSDYQKDKTTLFQKYGNILQEENYPNGILSVRYQIMGDRLFKIFGENEKLQICNDKSVAGVLPKNLEQECALDALMDLNIEIVALAGRAGTGKTMLALAAGLQAVTTRRCQYDQLIVTRPPVSNGMDLGFIKGSIDEKMAPWMQPIFDNLDVIMESPIGTRDGTHEIGYTKESLNSNKILQMEPMPYIRGRSLPKRYFIVDEAQNLTPKQVKLLVSRCGEGTKIVLTGDLEQVDALYLDAQSNGLAYLISKFINEKDFCYLNLREGVRSSLSEKGSRLL